MKHSLVVKFIAIILTACSLLLAIAGGASIVAIESADLYINSLDELQDQQFDSIAKTIASDYAHLYAAEKYSNLTYSMRRQRYPDPDERGDWEHWTVEFLQGTEVISAPKNPDAYPIVKEYQFTPMYPIVSLTGPNDSAQSPTTVPSAFTPLSVSRNSAYEGTKVPQGYLYYDTETVWEGTQRMLYYFYYYEAPEYTVRVYMQPEVLENSYLHVLTALYPLRYTAIAMLALGILVFGAGMGFLCWSAGRTRNGEIRPGGLNRLPLDFYCAVVLIAEYFLIHLFAVLWDWMEYSGPHIGNLSLICVNVFVAIILFIAFIFAIAAQVKVKHWFWWRHSVIGFCLGKLLQGIRFCTNSIKSLFHLLPIIWQWLVLAFSLAFGMLLIQLLPNSPVSTWLFLFVLAAWVIVICYGGYSFGILLSGIQKMSRGNLNHKIPTKHLRGSFLDFANQLNALSEAAVLAAKRQTRSERTKTELITNVSHDIKTPLTSIINFVDLLQKPHTEEEERQYLEVLSRQSSRMKKLIEDLMDLSKASAGSIPVEIVQMDVTEAINQALGEFADKLAAAQLTPVFRQPELPVLIQADGKLTWRVLSNLLSNAVKYALPGTRLYIDLLHTDTQVVLSIKNISRQELTASAEELMERFVQGDTSRNTEGSGLGLNIARSLMEVQGGHLHLTVDGDLFKVTLVFSGV